jgi:uncharacterized repeat protein (TIGR01451 family)
MEASMSGRHRSARLALWLLVAGLALGATFRPMEGEDDAAPRPGQGVRLGSPEPPLAPGAPADARGIVGTGEGADLTPPLVSIRVRVAAGATAGQDLEYRIVVENRSRAPAHHVLVRASKPTFAELGRSRPEPTARGAGDELQWQLGTLPAGENKEIVLVVKPTGEGDVQCCARVAYEHGQCVKTRLSKPELRLKRTGPTTAPRYDILTYRLEVSNNGATAAKDVVLEEELPAGLEFSDSDPSTAGDNPLRWKLGTIEPGRTRKVEYKVIAKELGALTMRGKVSAGGRAANESSTTVTVEQPRLGVEISGPKRRLANNDAVYQIVVTNPGSMPASGVRVLSQVPTDPPGIAFVRADQGGKLVGARVEWALGSMKAGEKRTLQLVLKATRAGKLLTRVRVEAERGIRAEAETETEFEAATGLTMNIEKAPEAVEVGRKTVCTVKVVNQGSADATRIAMALTLPEGVKATSAKGPTAEPGQQEGQVVRFGVLEKLAGGQEASYIVELEGTKKGQGKLKAEATADQLATSGPLLAEEVLTILD